MCEVLCVCDVLLFCVSDKIKNLNPCGRLWACGADTSIKEEVFANVIKIFMIYFHWARRNGETQGSDFFQLFSFGGKVLSYSPTGMYSVLWPTGR